MTLYVKTPPIFFNCLNAKSVNEIWVCPYYIQFSSWCKIFFLLLSVEFRNLTKIKFRNRNMFVFFETFWLLTVVCYSLNLQILASFLMIHTSYGVVSNHELYILWNSSVWCQNKFLSELKISKIKIREF